MDLISVPNLRFLAKMDSKELLIDIYLINDLFDGSPVP